MADTDGEAGTERDVSSDAVAEVPGVNDPVGAAAAVMLPQIDAERDADAVGAFENVASPDTDALCDSEMRGVGDNDAEELPLREALDDKAGDCEGRSDVEPLMDNERVAEPAALEDDDGEVHADGAAEDEAASDTDSRDADADAEGSTDTDTRGDAVTMDDSVAVGDDDSTGNVDIVATPAAEDDGLAQVVIVRRTDVVTAGEADTVLLTVILVDVVKQGIADIDEDGVTLDVGMGDDDADGESDADGAALAVDCRVSVGC